jgi:sugar phosphate isomerase/epimerase
MSGNKLTRRRFASAVGLGALAFHPSSFSAVAPAPSEARKFYTVLSLGRIGFKGSFQQSVELAAKCGFEGVDPDPEYFSQLTDNELNRLLDDLKAKNLRLGAAGMPVDFRKDEQTFSEGLKDLPTKAKLLNRVGVSCISTWIVPFSDHLTYLQNFRTHAYRLRACAQVLQDNGLRLGLEYCGPRTLWRSGRQPFLHTLSEMRELLVAIGTENLAVQLDSYHWYTAEETGKDLLVLRGQDVSTVDLNDAPAGLSMDQLMDLSRELPAATGIIPVRDFLGALVKIGYEGPIAAEPFNAALRAMPIDQACATTAAAMKKAFNVAGVA